MADPSLASSGHKWHLLPTRLPLPMLLPPSLFMLQLSDCVPLCSLQLMYFRRLMLSCTTRLLLFTLAARFLHFYQPAPTPSTHQQPQAPQAPPIHTEMESRRSPGCRAVPSRGIRNWNRAPALRPLHPEGSG